MARLEGIVQFYEAKKDAGKFKGFLRRSPALFERVVDGDHLLNMLKQAKANPKNYPVDQRKLKRRPIYKTISVVGDAGKNEEKG
jgi:nicotinic acid mononucleotide adenylyltransferase